MPWYEWLPRNACSIRVSTHVRYGIWETRTIPMNQRMALCKWGYMNAIGRQARMAKKNSVWMTTTNCTANFLIWYLPVAYWRRACPVCWLGYFVACATQLHYLRSLGAEYGNRTRVSTLGRSRITTIRIPLYPPNFLRLKNPLTFSLSNSYPIHFSKTVLSQRHHIYLCEPHNKLGQTEL